METLNENNRHKAKELFSEVPIWKAFIHSAIEDGFGFIIADSASAPTAAALFYGGMVIYAGRPDMATAEELVQQFPVQPAVLAWSNFWNRILENTYGDKLQESIRYHMPFSSYDRKSLSRTRSSAGVSARQITADDFERLGKDLGWEHQLHHYKDKQDFLEHGLGYVISENGEILSGASAFCRSSGFCECQVSTTPNQRRKGLASTASAAFLDSCHANGLDIPWDAANEISVALGRKLGYMKVEPYTIYGVFPEQ